jgi:hypothetical protein
MTVVRLANALSPLPWMWSYQGLIKLDSISTKLSSSRDYVGIKSRSASAQAGSGQLSSKDGNGNCCVSNWGRVLPVIR